jgi:putative FmdB family regulatory protein
MPIYEYVCGRCGRRTEIIQRMGDKPLTHCPNCGGKVKKAVSAPAIQFKGSGWYVTDYGSGASRKSDSEAKADKSDAGEKSEKAKSAKSEQSEKSEKSEKKRSAKKGSES